MPERRFYYAGSLEKSSQVVLEGEEAFHMLSVMRCKIGEQVELINGKGGFALAEIEKTSKGSAELIVQSSSTEPPPTFKIILAQALPRHNRLEMILEKGTELGVTDFLLFPGMLSEKKARINVERLQKILISALKQSGRLYIPHLEIKEPLSLWEIPKSTGFYGDLHSAAPSFFQAWQNSRPKEEALFFIGPEQGFHEKEELLLKNAGVIGVRLNQNTLRTDTAAICALSLLTHFATS